MSANGATLWTRSFTLLFFTNFFMWFGVASLIPTLPLFALQLGAAQSQVGFMVGGFGVASLLIRPYAGYVYDTYSKKTILTISLACFTVLLFLYPLAGTFLALIAFRTIHGFIFGVTSTGGGAIVADIVHASRRSEGVGLYGLGNTLAMSVAPAVGLWLATSYGYTVMFVVCGLFLGLSTILTFFVSSPPISFKKKAFSWKTCIETRVISVAIIVLMMGSIFGGLMSFIIIFSKEIGIVNGGIYFLLNSIGVAITRFFAGRVQDRFGPKPVVLFGFCVLALGLLVLALSKGLLLFAAASVLIGFGMGTIWPSLQTMVINMVEPDRRGVALATFGAAIDIGIAGGAVALGWLAALTSLETMYLICAIAIIIPFLTFKLYVLKDYKTKLAQLEASGLNEIKAYS